MAKAADDPATEVRARLGVTAAVLLALAFLAGQTVLLFVGRQPFGVDFLPLWVAAKASLGDPHLLYDFAVLTERQAAIIGPLSQPRPFPYPPSALPLLLPFGATPFGVAYLLWTGLTGLLFAVVVARTLPQHRGLGLALLALSPACVLVACVGQTTFLIAALMTQALVWLERRPILAGLLLGAAAAVKPSALLLAPIALAAGGHWRALSASLVGGVVAGLVSLSLFGVEPWFAWLEALPRFQALVDGDDSLLRNSLSPGALAVRLGLAGPALLAVKLTGAAAGAALAIAVFRRTEAFPPRLAALAGGALIASPYAMQYDAALLAPAAVLALTASLADRRWLLGLAGYMALVVAAMPFVGLLGVVAALALLVGPTLVPTRSANLSRVPAKVPA